MGSNTFGGLSFMNPKIILCAQILKVFSSGVSTTQTFISPVLFSSVLDLEHAQNDKLSPTTIPTLIIVNLPPRASVLTLPWQPGRWGSVGFSGGSAGLESIYTDFPDRRDGIPASFKSPTARLLVHRGWHMTTALIILVCLSIDIPPPPPPFSAMVMNCKQYPGRVFSHEAAKWSH